MNEKFNISITKLFTQDIKGNYEIIQVAWEFDDPDTKNREERALLQAEKELGFSGRIIDWKSYILITAQSENSENRINRTPSSD